jgi:PKD repeat protein
MNGVLASTLGERNSVISATNMIATGIINPNYNCAPKAEFNSPYLSVCENTAVTFTDYSYNGPVSNWLWSSEVASNTSTLQNGVLTFTNTGLVPVKLKVANSFGTDSLTKISYITVFAQTGATLNVMQDFETFTFPDTKWITSIPHFGSGFVLTNTVGASGQKSLFVNNYTDNPNEAVDLFTPKYDLNNVSGAQLTFKYAYAQQGSSDDALRIYLSSDCGSNWNMIYYQSGSGLASTAPVNGLPFTASNTAEWKSEAVNLAQYQGQQNVYLKFEFTSDPGGAGNNFFVDDINVSGTVGLIHNKLNSSAISISPNPAKTYFDIRSHNGNIEQIEIMDITGKSLIDRQGENTSSIRLECSSLSKGLYLVRLQVNGSTEFRKLIIE